MTPPPERGGDGKTMNENLKGGRGECRYCEKIFNNVAYHEAWRCPERPPPFDLMKESSMTPSDAKTPPPLTPKDSLSVEVEEIRARSNANHLFDAVNPPEKDLGRLLVIVDKLREQVELKDKAFEILKCVNVSDTVVLHKYADIESQLATAQAQLRRKDEAIAKALNAARLGYEEDLVLGGNDSNHFKWTIELLQRLAALAEGKEGGR